MNFEVLCFIQMRVSVLNKHLLFEGLTSIPYAGAEIFIFLRYNTAPSFSVLVVCMRSTSLPAPVTGTPLGLMSILHCPNHNDSFKDGVAAKFKPKRGKSKEKKQFFLNIHCLAQITPLFYYKVFYYKIISMQFCNIKISYLNMPYDILSEMFKLKL